MPLSELRATGKTTMNDTEFLNQTEHISDIFTKVMLKIMTPNLADGASDEITMSQFQALKHIAHNGPCTIGTIAEGLSVSQPAATMLIDRMVRKGLVERHPGRIDRRQSEVVLAAHGEEVLGRIEAERADRLAQIVKLMERSEREQFIESLERFVEAALETERSPGEACLRCGTDHHNDCIVSKSRGNG